MNNAIQWVYLGVGILAFVLPALVVGILRPWSQIGAQWRPILWGLTIGIGVLVGSFMLALIILSSGDLTGTRAEYMNAGLVVIGPVPGIVVFALVILGTVAGCTAVARGRAIPDEIDAATVRTLVCRGIAIDDLRAAHAPGPRFTRDEFHTAVRLGQADREAVLLRGRIIAYSPHRWRVFGPSQHARDLEARVRAATATDDAQPALTELRSIARRVEAGLPPIE